MRVRRVTALAAVVALALVLSACGGDGSRTATPTVPGDHVRGDHLTVYVAGPLRGPAAVSGQAVVNGAMLALDRIHARIGQFRIRLRTLDDVPPGGLDWSPAAASAAAQAAAANPHTIGYIGDYNSGASAVSIPILNRMGIAQVSPFSAAVGLTSNGPGSSPGEPQAYYPTALRTFARVVPSDYVQAQVQVSLEQRLGCTATYVLSDGEYDGDSAMQAYLQVAQRRHLQVVSYGSYVPTASSYLSVGQTIAGSGADCVLISAIPGRNAAKLVEQILAENPGMRMFATAGLADTSFTNPALGGIAESLDSRLMITAPTGSSAPGTGISKTFGSAYERRFGALEPAAIDGYEAMRLLIAAINRATGGGRRDAVRVHVVQALFGMRARPSPLGRFRITPDGDTSLRSYGVYRVVGGELRYWRTMTG